MPEIEVNREKFVKKEEILPILWTKPSPEHDGSRNSSAYFRVNPQVNLTECKILFWMETETARVPFRRERKKNPVVIQWGRIEGFVNSTIITGGGKR